VTHEERRGAPADGSLCARAQSPSSRTNAGSVRRGKHSLRGHPACVRVTLSFVHGPSNIEVAAREARGHQGGAAHHLGVRQDFDPAETGSAIPRLRAAEVTRPLELDPRGRGPDHQDIVRLDNGEIQSLCFADHYRIERRLGRGGMAIVFGGEDLDLGQPVAVKILVHRDAECYPAMRRFLREARLGTRIHHENVVEVFDYGSTPEGLVYLVMELLEGEDLRALIARHEGGLPWARVRSIMLQICEGLAAVHAAGIVHQDVKPSNCFRVLVDEGEHIKLIDFGVAVAIGERESPSLIVGTPQYMSPEQARGAFVDARSDIYSTGIILCELLTGKVPFNGSPIAVLSAQIDDQPPTLQQLTQEHVRIDPALQRIYERAVGKDPAQRFSSVEEMAAAIRAVAAEESLEISGELERADDRGGTSFIATMVQQTPSRWFGSHCATSTDLALDRLSHPSRSPPRHRY
jgi:serine/threonine protein kinase